MLTPDDLQAIGNIIDTKLDSKLSPLGKRLKKVEKTLDIVVRMFDKDIVETKKRVDRIEDHLNLPPIQHI